MNHRTSLEISDIYRHVSKRTHTCRQARNDAPQDTHQRAMLAGKVKAYVDILVFLETKYGRQLNANLSREFLAD